MKKGEKEEGHDAAAGRGIPAVRESRLARYYRERPNRPWPAYLEFYSIDDEEDDSQGVR